MEVRGMGIDEPGKELLWSLQLFLKADLTALFLCILYLPRVGVSV